MWKKVKLCGHKINCEGTYTQLKNKINSLKNEENFISAAKMQCKVEIEANVFDFNLSMFALLISIFSLSITIFSKAIENEVLLLSTCIVLVIVCSIGGFRSFVTKRNYIKLDYVLDQIIKEQNKGSKKRKG